MKMDMRFGPWNVRSLYRAGSPRDIKDRFYELEHRFDKFLKYFRTADCDTDHYLVVAKVRERLAVSKQTHRVQMERFNLKKLNEVEAKEQYRFEISSRFAALETWKQVDINKTWETIRI
ncbi:hypothetical protein B7P43_G12836 [Cryptotermes secundus]|uniref:Uncharacterized protein n=1 Tax=Cryptotermes secundus TaxID=105785 RepID=A0A2J7PBR8_9NEOP|nr:hypothetical protein B7P43_G12836 [Cryptotermes secundus]